MTEWTAVATGFRHGRLPGAEGFLVSWESLDLLEGKEKVIEVIERTPTKWIVEHKGEPAVRVKPVEGHGVKGAMKQKEHGEQGKVAYTISRKTRRD